MSKKCYYILNIILCVLMFLAVWFMTQNGCFWDDDETYAIVNNTDELFKSLSFNSEHGAGYIGMFLCRYLCFLFPLQLNLHPADFVCSPLYALIKSFFVLTVIYFLAKFIKIKNKPKAIYISCIFFLCCYFFFSVFHSQTYIFAVNYNFYRYLVSLIFFTYFFYYIFQYILNPQKKFPWYETLSAYICAYVTGSSSEILIASTTVFYFLLLSLLFIQKISKKNLLPTFKPSIKFHSLFLINLTSMFLFITSPGFSECVELRNDGIYRFKTLIIPFIKDYINILFCHEILYWIMCIAVLFIIFKYFRNKTDLKLLSLPLLFQFTVLLVYFMLVLSGESCVHSTIDGCLFHISHRNLRFLFDMIMLIPLLTYFSILLNVLITDENQKQISIVITILSLLLLGTNFYMNHVYTINDKIKRYKVENYKIDKIFRFQVLKGVKLPAISTEIDTRYSFWFDASHDGRIESNSKYTTYYAKTYNTPEIQDTYYLESEDGYKYFFENGGTFTEEELKNINFTRLKDDNFILNKI